ncbi:glycosyltransferase family 2 protein [Marinimicrobium alkaliphilum]|uniref:glycosyltransferase family 2 protein n=1 Tax=Marinimicrobium alkaliphilum TaxID=2202654 RepID=UPI001E47BFC0|nr:glycosyltransferase family 2 protein [Marinimicrobium alkaliphilum]
MPKLSIIVTAYNEKDRIEPKIKNTLALQYPREQLEVIIASDCSTDGTDDIATGFAEQGVKLVRAEERLGKENAQLAAINAASGDILVFSDVATEIPNDALLKLANYFSSPEVGSLSSEDRFITEEGKVAGEGAYVKYEMWLRSMESRLAGLVGLSGSFFAARAQVCQDWDIHSPSDFNTALNTAKAGLVAVSAPDVNGYYKDLKDPKKEYARKVRTVLRGMVGLSRHKDAMNPSKRGLFAFQVISHKLMRWAVPWCLLALFVVTLALVSRSWLYDLALIGQLAFYGVALLAHGVPRLQEIGPIRIVYFFVQVNIAVLHAGVKFLSGQRMTTWTPSAR